MQTADPDIVIEEREPPRNSHHGRVVYRRVSTGAVWEVVGDCDYRGDCIIGATIQDSRGEDVVIRDHQHIEELKQDLGVTRLISEMDVPVVPGFEGCCPLLIRELP